MERKKTPRRLSIEISEEQFQALEKLIPFGLKTPLFRTIVDDVIEILEGENPNLVIGAFIRNRVQYNITMKARDKSHATK